MSSSFSDQSGSWGVIANVGTVVGPI
jgi:hypothetical protein